jgi:hypothetical protein
VIDHGQKERNTADPMSDPSTPLIPALTRDVRLFGRITDEVLWRPTRRADEYYTKGRLSTRRGAVHSIGWLCSNPDRRYGTTIFTKSPG